jgi:hypothetical protein
VRAASLSLAALLALVLPGCGNTLQTSLISHSTLETMIIAPSPVYWLGASFHGLAITEASRDPSGAFTLEYGNCLQGGQGICDPPLRIVTSPDNSFLPGGSTRSRPASIRGVPALVAQAGRTVVLPTAGVVLDIYGSNATLAAAAARTAVPINEPAEPGGELPAPAPNTGFDVTPLPSQVPAPLRALGAHTHQHL